MHNWATRHWDSLPKSARSSSGPDGGTLAKMSRRASTRVRFDSGRAGRDIQLRVGWDGISVMTEIL